MLASAEFRSINPKCVPLQALQVQGHQNHGAFGDESMFKGHISSDMMPQVQFPMSLPIGSEWPVPGWKDGQQDQQDAHLSRLENRSLQQEPTGELRIYFGEKIRLLF